MSVGKELSITVKPVAVVIVLLFLKIHLILSVSVFSNKFIHHSCVEIEFASFDFYIMSINRMTR